MLGFAAANAQTGTLVVADGTVTNTQVPVRGYYTDYFLRCQTIYPETMLTDIAGKEIQELTYYIATPSSDAFDGTFEIRMGSSADAAFSNTTWLDVSSFELVYSGSLDCTGETLNITLTTPYTYTGGNLVIEVSQTTVSTNYASSTFSFYGITSNGASLQGNSSSSYASITTGSAQAFIPKTGFTVPMNCATPSGLSVTPAETSAVVAWTENGSATAWQIKLGDGEWIDVTTPSPYTITGLTSNTAYTLSLRSSCGGDGVSFSASTSFRTTCGTQSMPYNETFESYTAGTTSFVPCWTAGDGDASYVVSSRGYNSDKAFNLRGPAIVASPVITVGGQNVAISFDLRRQSDMSGTLAVGLALSPEMMASATYFDTIEPTDNEYHSYEFEFNNTLNIQSGCLVFKQICEETTVSYWMDNLDVRVLTDCKRPEEGEITDITPAGATVSWTTATAATAYEVAYGGTQDVDNADSIIATTATTLTIDGLESEETYYAWVRTVCGEEKTMWRYIGTFETEEPCVEVVNARVATTTTNAIALNWSINSTVGYSSTKVLVEYKTSDATEWTSEETTDNYFMLTGLEGGVTYNFRVRNICGSDSADAVTLTASTRVCGEVAGGTTTSSYIPSNTNYNYSYTQAVYKADEIGEIGTITGISYNNVSSSAITRTVDVYLANVDNASLSGGMIDISNFTQVVSDYEWEAAVGWSEIPFDVEFVHESGKDIVVAVNDNTGTWSSRSFSAHSGSGYYYYQDDSNIDPTSPSATYTSSTSTVADIRFTTICNSDCQSPLAVVSDVDAHSVTVMWTPMGSESSWTVGYKAINETAWTTVSNNVTAHEYTVSGLNAGTYYQIHVGANCGEDTSYATVATYTECDVIDVPYTENFNNGLNPCWAFGTAPTLSNGRLYSGYSTSGYAILPQFSAAINTLRMSFDAQYDGYSGTGSLQIGVVSNQNGVESFELVETVTVPTTATHFEVLLSSYSGTGSYIAIKFPTTYMYVDNVEVTEIPNCVHPTDLTVTNATENSLTLTWTENGTATQWVMKVNDETWQTVTNPYTLNDLTANTAYTVSVASLCAGDTSEVITGTFRTECAVIHATALPYAEGFENGIDCWTQQQISGTSSWNMTNSYYSAVEGSHFVNFNGSNDGNHTRLISPVFNLEGTENVTMVFAHAQRVWSGDQDSLRVEYRLSNSDEWQTLASYRDNISAWQYDTVVLPQVSSTVQIAFHGFIEYGYGVVIDDLVLMIPSDCQRPDSGSITVNSPIAATATWSAATEATAYEFAYGTASDVNQALETLPATGTTLTLSALTPNTTYYAWVRTVCGEERTMWLALGSFTTQPACAQIQNARVTNAEVTELTIGWQIDATVGYASTATRVMYKKATGQTWNEANDTTVTGTQLTLTGLEAGTTYNFRIYNICSTDTASYVALNGTTDVACAKVVDAQVLATAMSAVAIGWNIDSEVGYASTAVEVRYRTGDEEWNDTVVTGTNLVLTGLASGTTYNFSIRNICSADTSQAVTLNASTSSCGEVGDGSAVSYYVPTYCSYNYSYTQSIYTSDEVGNIDTIHGISYNFASTETTTRTVNVYIADVENASFTDGFIDITNFTQVASNYNWNLSEGWCSIPFTQDFVHQSGKDIVIAIDDNTGSWSGRQFKVHAGSSLYVYNDYTDQEPTNPGDGSTLAYSADIRFNVTCNVTCPAPILVVDAVEAHSATLNWTVLGEETSWTVEYKKLSDTTWTTFSTNYTTTSCTITGLIAATAYQFRVGAICGEETAYASAATTTECAPYEVTLTQDFAEDFNSGSGIPICWNTENDNWYRSTTGGHSGGNVYTSSDDMLITPQLDCSTLALGAQVRFWYKLPEGYYGGNSTLKVHYRTAENGDWTAIESATFTTSVETWTEVEIMLPNSENASYYQIAFESQAGTGYYTPYLYLDDIVVEAAPTCPRVNEFTLDAVTTSTATISWTSTATLFEVKYRTGNGAWTTVTPAPTSGTVQITGLEPSTSYEVTVRAICAADDTSRVATYSFSTECGVIASTSLPYFEGFESGIGCWEQEMIEGSVEWNIGNSNYTALEGSSFVNMNDNSDGNETRLISPVFNLDGMENVTLSFAHAQKVWASDQDSLKVEYRLSSTDEWHVLATYDSNLVSWVVETIQIPQVSSTFQFAFHGYAEYGYGIVIDSLTLSGDAAEVPHCDVPTNVATSNLTANTVTVTWTGSAAQYEVKIIGGGQTITETVTTNSFTTEALTQETSYTVEVRALCDNGLNSDWTAALSFTTPQPECGTPVNVQTTTTATTVTITWTGYASEYDVKVTGSEIAPINRTVNTNSCTIEGLVPASTYQVIVRAKCNGQYTEWTEPVTFYTADGEGIEAAEGEYTVSMYPNPAKEQVSIRIDGMSGKVNVALIDMSGRTVMSDTMENGETMLNVSTLAKGTYFVRMNGEDISTVRKLVVQ